MRTIVRICLLWILIVVSANAADFTLTSNKFKNNEKIPKSYTCDEGNITPELQWKNPPAQTKSFVLIFSSLDTPVGTPLYNWILYNIPRDTNELAEGIINLPDGTLVGKNSFDDIGYRGPCPPDASVHRYVITIYALNSPLDLTGSAEVEDVFSEMKGHVLNQAELRGVYNH